MSQAKRLGDSGENGVVRRARESALVAARQPGSGVYQAFPNDLVIQSGDLRVLGESKVRSLQVSTKGVHTWTLNFDWLVDALGHATQGGYHHAALFVRPKSSQKRYVLIEEATYFDLLRRAG